MEATKALKNQGSEMQNVMQIGGGWKHPGHGKNKEVSNCRGRRVWRNCL